MIPEGTYTAIKFDSHGGKTMEGSSYSWNSFLEVVFDMVSAANPEEDFDIVIPTNPPAPVNPNKGDDQNPDENPDEKADDNAQDDTNQSSGSRSAGSLAVS